ncbi:hypothetical protein NCC49_003891 [Naganishia albida]|nr:hypothetical protein NCC49_003891 [Naganishia albida]
MSHNGNPYVRSGHALPEPYDRQGYPSSPAVNGSHPSHAEHLHQMQHARLIQQSHSPQYPYFQQGQGESQGSYSYRSDASFETQGTERERQRLVQGWAFDTQPPEVPLRSIEERPPSRDSIVGRESQPRQGGYWGSGGVHRAGLESVDRSQSPLDRRHHQLHNGRTASPASEARYYAAGPSSTGQGRHEGHQRVGSAMNIDHLVRPPHGQQQQYLVRESHGYGKVTHHSPLNEHHPRTTMESTDQSSHSVRHEYPERQRSIGSGEQRMGSTAEQRTTTAMAGEQYRHPGPWTAVPFPPVPVGTQMEDAEVLVSMRYGHLHTRPQHPHHSGHQQYQQFQQQQHHHHRPTSTGPSPLGHLQRPSGRSSVVPGTPSERYDTSEQGSTPIRPLHTRLASGQEALGEGGGRVIAVASSPPLERRKVAHSSPVRREVEGEELVLEPTQRNEVTSSPVNPGKERSSVKEQTPITKAPGKRPNKTAQPTGQPAPRPAFTSKSAPAQKTDEDTFILAQDRKVAFKKRSNAEMEECMMLGAATAGEGTSPAKRKRAKAVLEPDGQRVQARGELQGRKIGQVVLGKVAVAKSPVKKQKTMPVPAEGPVQLPHPGNTDRTYLQQLFLPAGSSDTSIGNTTAEIVAKVPTYRRLQKTSIAGSSGPLVDTVVTEAVSLQGIDSYERRGSAGMMEDVQLEETMEPHEAMLSRSVLVLDPTELAEPEKELDEGLKAPSQSRSTSLTPAPDSEEEPRIETLVVPSPVRQKTYRSPAKKRRVRQVSTVRDASSSDVGDSEEDEPRRRRVGKKQGRVKKKLMSPTVSPPPSANGRKQRKPADGSVTSLSDAPVEERWDDIPPPVMKDDPRDRDFRPAAHSQLQSSPTRKISTRRESTTERPILRAKRILGRWRGDFYTGDLIGKEGHKYVLVFDDKETARVGLDDLRQCVFHIGDEIRTTVGLKPRITDGTLVVVGTVNPDLDMSQPLMSNELLSIRGKSGKTYEIEVQYCSFSEDNEDALDDRQFGETELDELCALSDSTPAPKKPARNGRSKPVAANGIARIPTTRRQHRSDSRPDSTRPLYNFAFLITSNPKSADKSAQTKALKAKIIKAGGQVMEEFFDVYPKPRGDSISADDIRLAKHLHKLHGIFLLVLNPVDAHSPCLTEKVMMALALGVPCLSASYIEELLQEEQTTSWRSFLLSAGLSLQLKSEVSQIVDLNYGQGPERLIKKIDAEGVVRRPFVNRSFLIMPDVNYIIPSVCAAMGAENVTMADTRSRSRKATSATPDLSGRSASDFDYVIVPDDAPQPRGKKEIARTCNVEWVKQCLIMGKLYPPSFMTRPAHWTEKKDEKKNEE